LRERTPLLLLENGKTKSLATQQRRICLRLVLLFIFKACGLFQFCENPPLLMLENGKTKSLATQQRRICLRLVLLFIFKACGLFQFCVSSAYSLMNTQLILISYVSSCMDVPRLFIRKK